MTAVVNENIDQVKSIIDQAKQLDILRALIDKTDVEGRSPLWQASGTGVNNICQLLLENKADVNKSDKTLGSPLFVASQKGHTEVVQTLLDNNASIDQPKNDDATPLFIACEKGQSTVVQMLIDNGASIHQPMTEGATPLFIASQNGHTAVVQLLIDSRASIHQPANDGYTPIMAASQIGHSTVLETLLKNVQQEKRREVVNDRSNDYNVSPLIAAITGDGQLQTVKTLIECNADPNLKVNGKSPLAWAQEKNKQDIVAYLQTIRIKYFT